MNLDECKTELRRIIEELQDIETGVRRDFSGIGEQLCGNCIGLMINKYEYVSRELKNVDYNLLAKLIKAIS